MVVPFDASEFNRDLVNWCKHHFGENLIGVGLFDPARVRSSYPRGDINVLVVLDSAPENERERYDLITEMLVQNLAPNKMLTCRVQTREEMNDLAEMKLPLLKIYTTKVDILFDPKNILGALR